MKKFILLVLGGVIFFSLSLVAFAGDCFQDPIYDRDWNAKVTTGAFVRDVACMEGSVVKTTLSVGEVVHVIAETDGWYKIERNDGTVGWVGQWLVGQTNESFNKFSVDPVVENEPMSDAVGHRNEEAIMWLYENQIINGHADGLFHAELTLNRAEILKIMIEATEPGFEYGKEDFDYKCFDDVEAGMWYTPYVCYSKETEMVKGFSDGTFRPANPVLRGEAVKIILETKGFEDVEVAEDVFSDVYAEDWYAPYLKTALDVGLLEESSGYFNPNSQMLRGDVAYIVYKAVQEIVEARALVPTI